MSNHIIPTYKYCVSFGEHDDFPEVEPSLVRVYKSSPEGVTLQIRGNRPLVKTSNHNHKVKARNLFASVVVNAEQLADIIKALQEELEGIRS